MKTENKPFVNRIEFYSWLEKYMKAGNNIICLQSAIKNKEVPKIPFDISSKDAIIIINDFIANNKKKVENNTQLQLFTL